ncbi:hypothetical protein QUQ58_004876 [Escherichia coli]|nr:hypothetical protein [Escherichia coli]
MGASGGVTELETHLLNALEQLQRTICSG